MSALRLLLLSNSTNHGGTFLGHARDVIEDFLGADPLDAAFVPYAAVRVSWSELSKRVAERFHAYGHRIRPVHAADDPRNVVRDADAVVVSGGNTFCLLDALYARGLLDVIKARVAAGAPYLGWSAGANVASPTIRTTNDMPIVEPPGFNALHLVPFQINPHFTDARIPDHGGETREDRLLEFIEANPDMPVVGLREGSMLRIEGKTITLKGERPARIFTRGREPFEVGPAESLQFLMR